MTASSTTAPAFLPSTSFELLLKLGDAAIGQLAGALVLAAALRIGEFDAKRIELGLELLRVGQLVLFRLPARREVGRLLFQRQQLAFELLQPLLRARIAFLLQRLLLDLQPHDLAVDRVELVGLGIDLHLQPRRGLVDQVDGLVRQEAVGDVAVRQGRRRHDRAVGDADAVVLLVLVLQAAQDRDGVLDARLVDEHRLEAPRQRGVLLDVLAVFVERGRADAMQLAAGERGLQQVGGVHRAVGLAGADDGVHLVDEQDDAAARRRHLLQHGLEPLLELAAVFRAGDQRAHVEREQLLVLQAVRHVAVDDAQRQALDDGGLADAGLADQHRIVLGAAGQHLDGAADFLVAADHRIELAVAGGLGQVAGVFLQRVIGVLGRLRSRRCGPCATVSMAALRFCGVTPALARILPASLSFSSAIASSSRSTVTKLSPAFSAIFSALSNSRAVAGCEIDLAGARRPTPSASCRAPLRRRSAPAASCRRSGRSGPRPDPPGRRAGP